MHTSTNSPFMMAMASLLAIGISAANNDISSSSSFDATPRHLSVPWIIGYNGNVTVEMSPVGDDPIIHIPYIISDRVYGFSIYDETCEGNETTAILSNTTITSSAADGFLDANLTLPIKQNDIEQSDLWFAETGKIKLCVVARLFLDGASTIVMSSLNTNLAIEVDKTSDFQIENVITNRWGQNVQDITIDYSVSIDAYQCDSDNGYARSNSIISQGGGTGTDSVLTICVTTNDSTAIQVGGIFELTLAQSGNSGTFFKAVIGGTVTHPELVRTGNVGDVYFAHVFVVSDFFRELNPANIHVSGRVILDMGARRRLMYDNLPNIGVDVALESSTDAGSALPVPSTASSLASNIITAVAMIVGGGMIINFTP